MRLRRNMLPTQSVPRNTMKMSTQVFIRICPKLPILRVLQLQVNGHRHMQTSLRKAHGRFADRVNGGQANRCKSSQPQQRHRTRAVAKHGSVTGSHHAAFREGFEFAVKHMGLINKPLGLRAKELAVLYQTVGVHDESHLSSVRPFIGRAQDTRAFKSFTVGDTSNNKVMFPRQWRRLQRRREVCRSTAA